MVVMVVTTDGNSQLDVDVDGIAQLRTSKAIFTEGCWAYVRRVGSLLTGAICLSGVLYLFSGWQTRVQGRGRAGG